MTIEELRILITAKTEGLQEGINKAKSKLNDFKGTSDNMETSTTRNINKMKTQYDSLLKKLDNVNAQAELQQRKLAGLQEKLSRYSGVRADSPQAMRLQEQILSTEGKLQRLIDTSDKTVNTINDLDSKMNNAGISTEVANKKFTSLRDRLDQIKDKFKNTGHEAQRSTGKIAGFATMLNRSFMRILKRIFIFNLIYKMIRGLMTYMNEGLKTNNKFASSLNAIKANLRVAFQPIYDFILPAINALMRALATLSGYIASITSALFGKTYKQSYDAAKGLENAKKGMDGFGASAKKAQGALAGFDEINSLDIGGDSGGGGGAGDFEMEMPETPEFELGWLDKFKEKLEPTIEALQRLVNGLEPLRDFVAQGAMDFYNKFLIPVGNWVFGEGLPRFIDAITNGLGQIDWQRINDALARLWDTLAPFTVNVGEGLLWLWENVLVPFGTWVGNEIVPRFLDLLAGVLKVLNSVIEALKPLGIWLWEEFLQPLAQWTGSKILNALDWLNDKLEVLSKWINENKKLVESLTIVMGGIAVAWGLVNVAIILWNIVGAIATGVATGLGIAIGILTSPITLVILAIGALIAIGILLYKNWEEIKTWGTKIWGEIKRDLIQTWEDIKSMGRSIWKAIKDNVIEPIKEAWANLKETWDKIKKYILEKWDEIKTGISSKASALVEAIKSPFNEAKKWIDGIISDSFNWGKNLIGGFVDGIKSMTSKVGDAVKGVAGKVGDFIGFKSPTKEGPGRDADKWMPNMMNMLAQGIEDNVFKVAGAVNATANALSGIDKSDNANTIASAVGSAMMAAIQMGSGSPGDNQGSEVVIELDGVRLGRAILPNLNQEADRLGYKPILQV